MQIETPIDYTKLNTVRVARIDKVDVLEIANKHCQAKVSLFGAHLLSFAPSKDQRERLWLSPSAAFDKSKAIRGGIPVCWPWFADIYPLPQISELQNDPKYPAHGFVRTQDWDVIAINETEKETRVTLRAKELGLFGFEKSLIVEIEFTFADKCTIKLISKNLSGVPQNITAALHSYLDILDIDSVELNGIAGRYIDKLKESRLFPSPTPYRIQQEVDRIHLVGEGNAMDAINVSFQDKHVSASGNLEIAHAGHDSIIIWNPWIGKSAKMADMAPDGYKSMLCVEAAITSPYAIEPGEEHVLQQVIT